MANKKKTVEELVSEQTETELVDFLIEGNIITDEEVQNGTPLETPSTHIASYGETYPSIAAMFPKEGMTNFQRATEISAKNKNTKITSGKTITL